MSTKIEAPANEPEKIFADLFGGIFLYELERNRILDKFKENFNDDYYRHEKLG